MEHPLSGCPNTHRRRGLGGPNADGSGADAVLGVPEADTASDTRAVGTTSESGRSVRVGVRVRSSGFAAARIRSFTRIETRAKVFLEWVLPDERTSHFVWVFSTDDLCDVFATVCKPTKSTRALDFGGHEIFARDVPFCMGI